MIRTRVFIIRLAVALTSMLFTVSAWSQSYKGDITVLAVSCEQLGDSVYVDMDISLSDVRVTSNMSVELVPCLVSSTRDYCLPAVSIKGRTVYKAWEREKAMRPRGLESDNAVLIIKGHKTDTVIRYRYTVPYEAWMAEARLNLCKYDSGCGRSMLTDVTAMVDRPERVTSLLAYVVPEAEEVKRRELQVECKLDFVVNRTNIDPSYMNNPLELARIRNIIDELESDPAISIASIGITGFASPEGNMANNFRLSEGRALSMRNYLLSQYDFPKDLFQLTFGGENWSGLVRDLKQNPIDHYGQVLDIIETTSPDQTRKNRIMRLEGGAPYRYMLRNIYPRLRTAVCTVEYHIKGFEVADAVRVYRTHPQNLSLNEFYMVAGTMTEGSAEFAQVFVTALGIYPDDEIANLNAAVASLQETDTRRAAYHLEKVVNNRSLPEYHNAMGALLLLQGDIAGARVHFGQAAGELEAARENLRMISKQQ